MRNREWEQRIGSREWEIGNGKWGVGMKNENGNGKWETENGNFFKISCLSCE